MQTIRQIMITPGEDHVMVRSFDRGTPPADIPLFTVVLVSERGLEDVREVIGNRVEPLYIVTLFEAGEEANYSVEWNIRYFLENKKPQKST